MFFNLSICLSVCPAFGTCFSIRNAASPARRQYISCESSLSTEARILYFDLLSVRCHRWSECICIVTFDKSDWRRQRQRNMLRRGLCWLENDDQSLYLRLSCWVSCQFGSTRSFLRALSDLRPAVRTWPSSVHDKPYLFPTWERIHCVWWHLSVCASTNTHMGVNRSWKITGK